MRRIFAVPALVAMVGAPAWCQSTKKPAPAWSTIPPITSPQPQAGRFVATQPQYDPSNGYPNFLWVLDTTTGNVTAYRLSSYTEGGKHIAWAVDRLETSAEILLRRITEPK